MDKAQNPWTVPVVIDDIPDDGLHRKIEAPDDIRAAVAKLAGVRAITRLSAVFDVHRQGEGVHVTGRVAAQVGQNCVVSLEPIETDVNEAVDTLFVPPAAQKVDPDDLDAPEPLVGGRVDLGALATEFLILGIDPYPRKPGASFAAPAAEDAGGGAFAALAALKKQPGGGRS